MSRFPTIDRRMLAATLGMGGLIPFVVLAWLSVRDPATQSAYRHSLLMYAASITSFVGAVHWGLAVRSAGRAREHLLQLVWSVIPSLASWAVTASAGTSAAGLIWIAGVLVACLIVDLLFLRTRAIPGWYFALRSVLTSVASCSLVLASLSGTG